MLKYFFLFWALVFIPFTLNAQQSTFQTTEPTVSQTAAQEISLIAEQTIHQKEGKATSQNAEKITSYTEDEVISWRKFSFENDAIVIFDPSDEGYTNGFLFSWGENNFNDFSSLALPDWIRYITAWTYINQGDKKNYSVTYGIAQLMYTPDELEESALIEDDRPYAGTLLWGSKIRSYGHNRANSLGLTVGLVGPASLAEQSQTLMHQLIGATEPKGWDNQINNELVFRIEGEHIERFYVHSFSDSLSFDSSAYSKLGVGNLRSEVGTGLTLRFGNMLDQSYAMISPNSSNSITGLNASVTDKFDWQIFTTVYASYLFNDITLTGNTFSDSHSVELEHEQFMISIGTAIIYNNWGVTFSVHHSNDQFVGQKSASKYGSLTLSYHYL